MGLCALVNPKNGISLTATVNLVIMRQQALPTRGGRGGRGGRRRWWWRAAAAGESHGAPDAASEVCSDVGCQNGANKLLILSFPTKHGCHRTRAPNGILELPIFFINVLLSMIGPVSPHIYEINNIIFQRIHEAEVISTEGSDRERRDQVPHRRNVFQRRRSEWQHATRG